MFLLFDHKSCSKKPIEMGRLPIAHDRQLHSLLDTFLGTPYTLLHDRNSGKVFFDHYLVYKHEADSLTERY